MYEFAIKSKACLPFLWRALLEPCILLFIVEDQEVTLKSQAEVV